MAVPFDAKEQLRMARELGHTPSFERRDFPEYPDAPPKIRMACTCGYQSTWRRSEKAALGTLVWHLGMVLGEDDAEKERLRRNGVSVPRNVGAPRHA